MFLIRSAAQTPANNWMEYFCDFEKISCWGYLYFFEVNIHCFLCCFIHKISTVNSCKNLVLRYKHYCNEDFMCRGENGELRVGVRRLARQSSSMTSSVISSESMHGGVLATASFAVATQTRFSVFYKPR